MEWIWLVLWKLQSGHNSVHRGTDRWTDGQTDGRTTWNRYTPLSTSLKPGGMNTNCSNIRHQWHVFSQDDIISPQHIIPIQNPTNKIDYGSCLTIDLFIIRLGLTHAGRGLGALQFVFIVSDSNFSNMAKWFVLQSYVTRLDFTLAWNGKILKTNDLSTIKHNCYLFLTIPYTQA